MDLGAWQKHKVDGVRARRLATGYLTGAVLITAVLGTVAATAAKAYGLSEETVIEAALVDNAKEEPEVVVKEEVHEQRPQKAKTLAAIVEPTKLDTKLVEKEPTVRSSDNPYANEDPYALMAAAQEQPAEERPKAQEALKIVEKPKAVVQKDKSGPIRVTEDVTPPHPIAGQPNQPPAYPAEAKAAGIEGTVVVRFVVTEKGEVAQVQVVSGPPELIAVCLAAVKTWRFTPAIREGEPVAVTRNVRFPFHIKT
jgi:protein TonB